MKKVRFVQRVSKVVNRVHGLVDLAVVGSATEIVVVEKI